MGEALQKCVISCHPHRTQPYRTSSWQWWLQHLWARLHVFYQETITGVLLRPESLWHSSCHICHWGVWANDQVDSAGCTTFTLNCQVHCECPTVFPLELCFHSEAELLASLFVSPLKSPSRNIGSYCFHSHGFADGLSRTGWDVSCLSFLMIPIARDSITFLSTIFYYLVLVEYDPCHLSGCLYGNSIISGVYVCICMCVYFRQPERVIIKMKLSQANIFLVMLTFSNTTLSGTGVNQYSCLIESRRLSWWLKEKKGRLADHLVASGLPWKLEFSDKHHAKLL